MTNNTSNDEPPPPPPPPPPVFANPPTEPGQLKPRSGPDALAIASLICGILSICAVCVWCVQLPLGISGIVCGYVSKDRSGLRTAGLVCSIIGTLIGLAFVAIAIISNLRY